MAIDSRVDHYFVAEFEVGLGGGFDDAAGEFMAEDDGEVFACEGVWVFFSGDDEGS